MMVDIVFSAFSDAAWALAGPETPTQVANRVLMTLARLTPLDAAAVLTLSPAGDLRILSQRGLQKRSESLSFQPEEHPRLKLALSAQAPLRFTDAAEADPYDGLLASYPGAVPRVHACIAAPLVVCGTTVGLLTIDAICKEGLDSLHSEALELGRALLSAALFRGPLGFSPQRSAASLDDEVDLLAPLSLPVLVLGETGVGKERVARILHERSGRKGSFVAVNCAALPSHLIEAELFGHTRGAFTGAQSGRAGKFAAAQGGTLLLDEVGDLPLLAQAVLLRVLEGGAIQRLGEDTERVVDVRVIAATNKDLEEEVAKGRFREDLYYRLAVYPLRIPPLRERPQEAVLLATTFATNYATSLGAHLLPFSEEVIQVLTSAPWPGNVRQLKGAVERAVLRALLRSPKGQAPAFLKLGPGDFASQEGGHGDLGGTSFTKAQDQARGRALREALLQCEGNMTEAAKRLGISRSFMYKEAQRLGIKK